MKLFTQRAINMAAKAIVPCLVLLNGQAIAQSHNNQNSAFSAASGKDNQQKLPDNVSPNWFEQATAYVNQYEHRFHPMSEYGVFKSVSSEQHLTFLLNAGGYTVQNVRSSENQSSWTTSFSIKGAGRQNFGWIPASDFNVVTDENKLVYSYSNVDVEYSNTKDGVRQNFVIRKNFEGKGNLVVKMGINSDLNAVLVNQQKLTFIANGAKESALNYEDLKVWDAKGNILPAHMEISADAKEVSIVVNDSKAVYPVTIDPLNTTPTWSTSADDLIPTLLNNLSLQVSTLYGYSVAGLGDVNGDGYDDVAVGAPGMVDVIVGTGLANVGGV
ncbi:MAG: integrin alpha, partial [Flavitalea sp.]